MVKGKEERVVKQNPLETEDRKKLRRAVMAAFGMAPLSSEANVSAQRAKCVVPDTPLDRERLPRAAAVLPVIEDMVRSATDEADSIVRYVDTLVEHLEAIGCKYSRVRDYLRLADQTLASLYFAVLCPNPSPTEVKKLALRYALDARVPITGPIERYHLNRREDGWEIREYPDIARPSIPFPPRIIRNALAVRILDGVFRHEPNPFRLMEFIELVLNGPPSKDDALPLAGRQRFAYRITEDSGGEPTVTLWIGKTQVKLPRRRDVHLLLQALCETQDLRLTGPQCREKLDVANASEACGLIRRALRHAHPEAGEWLLTGPIGWAHDKAPRLRPRGRRPENSRE